ncbi:hypothetical protein GX586_12020 [bacterium]|nr:hypothetical protein [bacterium]
MEIPLSPGRTIRVTGTVRDGEGTPVSHAVIRLGRRGDPDMDGVDTYKFTPFRGVTKEDGTFAIEYVPCGDTLVPHVHHADYPDTAFSDAAIDTQRGDAHVDLVILPGLAVAGIVRFASGGMVSNAPVWAARVTRTEPDEWNRELTDSYQALGRTRTETNERGEFLVRRIGRGERFILKSGVRGYPSAFVGPYDPQHPAPSSVEIVISESGGRIAGRLGFPDGTQATNVTAHRDVWRKDGPNLFSRATEPMVLDIEEDGTYVSGLLNPVTHDIGFTLGKADPVMRTVAIHDGGTELVDVIFTAPRAVTGVVLDATTSLPVAGVTISGRRADILRDRTGEDGVFMFAPQQWITLTFRHPD